MNPHGPSHARTLIIPGMRFRASVGGRVVEVLEIEDDGERARVREIVSCDHLLAKLLAPGEPCAQCAVRKPDPFFYVTLTFNRKRGGWFMPQWYDEVAAPKP